MHDFRATLQSAFAFAASLLLALGCGGVQAATAPGPVEAPELRVGDRWVYHVVDGYRQKIVWDETREITAIGPDGITVNVTYSGPSINSTRTEVWAAPGVVRSGAIHEA